ncbi:MAG: peptide chain release factor-like protein [Planctomycetales bacterium]|nr:peptide chain release factor-like protein [Planctomycetales bacterium]
MARVERAMDVAVHPCELDDAALMAGCDVRRQRRSGPGGQHRNKVETGVFVTHRDSGATAQATEARSQQVNMRQALFRLRLELARGVRGRRGESPSPRWCARAAGGKIRVSTTHDDFPALLAEALDVLTEAEFDVPTAAQRLAVTGSQLGRLLGQDPPALEAVNRERAARGLRTLVR